jgi:hypothetical protein
MTSFGQQFLSCVIPSQALELEKTHSRNEKFAMLDNLIYELTIRSLHGERIVSMSDDEIRGGSIQIHDLSSIQTQFIQENFDFARQRERGNWTLPEKEHIDVGWLNLTHYFGNFSYFPLNVAGSEICRVKLEKSPEAVFLWSVFSPFMEKLLYPINLRSSLVGAYDLEELKSIWEDLDDFYARIEISDVEEMNVFRFRGGWSKLLNRTAQLEAKKKLLAGLSAKINTRTGTFYRLYALRSLIEQYYKKAKSDGIVKRKQVITKTFQPFLSGYFGGDWLAFVEYLGERPHPDEHIVTGMPKPQIYAGGAVKAKEIAQQQGIPADEIAKIAAALWQKPSGDSPIEERTICLKKYWEVFDGLHARQKSGMKSLWGVIDETGRIDFETPRDDIFHPELYLELLPADLISDIERLWGTTMLNKYPESIVSEPFPHAVMANVLGPALSFWQNCALTAWFLCEGPYSRTDMEGLEHHQRYNLAKLEDMSTPVDKALFAELIEAEKKLGPAESIEKEKYSNSLDFGITISMSVSGGSRRAGFEKLRDIITRNRRAWTQKYFEQYLKRQWETEISQAANTFFLKMSEKGGKPPTVKQFVSTASSPTKNWFGGDISLLYTAIGEKIPFTPHKRLLMPKDKVAFVKNVAKLLPSKDFDYFGQRAGEEIQKRYVEELALKALSFIQFYEAIGETPTLKEFSAKFKYHSPVLHEDENQAWEIYTAAVRKALQLSISQKQKSETPKNAQQEVKITTVEQKMKEESAIPKLSNKPQMTNSPKESEGLPPKATQIIENKTNEAPVHRSWWERILGRK